MSRKGIDATIRGYVKAVEIERDTLKQQRDELLTALSAALADHDSCVASLEEMSADWVDAARAAIAKFKGK